MPNGSARARHLPRPFAPITPTASKPRPGFATTVTATTNRSRSRRSDRSIQRRSAKQRPGKGRYPDPFFRPHGEPGTSVAWLPKSPGRLRRRRQRLHPIWRSVFRIDNLSRKNGALRWVGRNYFQAEVQQDPLFLRRRWGQQERRRLWGQLLPLRSRHSRWLVRWSSAQAARPGKHAAVVGPARHVVQ